MLVGLFVSGCATTSKVELMIDAEVAPINAQIDGQNAASAATLEEMKGFVDWIGRALDADVKELQASIDGLEDQLDILTDGLAAAREDISGTQAKVSGTEREVTRLDASVEALSGIRGCWKMRWEN